MDTPIEESNLAHIGSEEDAAARKVSSFYLFFNNGRQQYLKFFCEWNPIQFLQN